MIPNINNETGVRMGVIACRSLDPGLEQELWYGPQAANLSEYEAYEDAKRDARHRFEQAMEEAEIAAAETDPSMSDSEKESFIEQWFDIHHEIQPDEQSFVDSALNDLGDTLQIDEPEIEGTYEGVSYRIGWLGGAPLLWVVEGPIGECRSLCSPCVPNAGDLDSGFVTNEEIDERQAEGDTAFGGEPWVGVLCYCVPRNWLRKEQS